MMALKVKRRTKPIMAVEELRKNDMMAHLLDALDANKDIGHYGRLNDGFAVVGRHFLAGWSYYIRKIPEASLRRKYAASRCRQGLQSAATGAY